MLSYAVQIIRSIREPVDFTCTVVMAICTVIVAAPVVIEFYRSYTHSNNSRTRDRNTPDPASPAHNLLRDELVKTHLLLKQISGEREEDRQFILSGQISEAKGDAFKYWHDTRSGRTVRAIRSAAHVETGY